MTTRVRIDPEILNFDAQIMKFVQASHEYSPSTLLLSILKDIKTHLFPKLVRKQKESEFENIGRDVVSDVYQRLKESCEHVSANIKLTEVKRRMNETEWIQSYPKHARQNKEYIKASHEVRRAERRVSVSGMLAVQQRYFVCLRTPDPRD